MKTTMRTLVTVTVLGLSTGLVFAQPGAGPHRGVAPGGPHRGLVPGRPGDGLVIAGAVGGVLGGLLAPRPTVVVETPVLAEPAPVFVRPAVTTVASVENQLLAVLDRNGDGIIDEEEILLASASLRKLDLNRDGQISPAEYCSSPVQTSPVQVFASAPAPRRLVVPVTLPRLMVEPSPVFVGGPVVGPVGPGYARGPHGVGPVVGTPHGGGVPRGGAPHGGGHP